MISLELFIAQKQISFEIINNSALEVNYPARIPNLKGKLAAKKAVITTITADDIPGLDRGRIGDPGSPTKVPRMFPPVMPEPGIIIDEGSVEASVAKLMQLIKD